MQRAGKPRPGARRAARSGWDHRAGRIELDPLRVADEGGLAVLGQTGEYLTWSNGSSSSSRAWPRAGSPTRTARSGRSRSARASRSTTARRSPPRTSSRRSTRTPTRRTARNALSAFDRRALARAARRRSTTHRRVQARRAERQLPLPRRLRQLQPDHPPRRLRRPVGADLHRHRPVEARHVHARAGVTYAKNPTTGTRPASRSPTPARSRSTPRSRRAILAIQGGEVDVLSQFSVAGGEALLNDPNIASPSCARHRAPRRSTCAPTRSRSPTSACARRWRSCSTGRPSSRALPGQGRPRQRQPVRSRLSRRRDTTVPQRGQTSSRPRRFSPTPASRTASRSSSRPGTNTRSRSSRSCSRTPRKEIGHRRSRSNVTDAGTYYSERLGKSPGSTLAGNHRLRPPRRAERVPHGPAHYDGTWNTAHFTNSDVRPADRGVRRRARHRLSEGRGQEDPGAPARRDAGASSRTSICFLSATTANVSGIMPTDAATST